MATTVAEQIRLFESFPAASHTGLRVSRPHPRVIVLEPEGPARTALPAGKRFLLTFMGLTHGNESAGAAVLNRLLGHISAGTVRLPGPVAMIMGNPEAALENKRFLDRDLNRSFARTETPVGHEEKRARELEPFLAESAWLVDYHQVTRPIDRSFFIFPYERQAYLFARAIAPWQTIVTHWGDAFSKDGMCTDEYVNARGGIGISLELGQNGLDPAQIAIGVECGLAALRAVADGFEPARWRAHHQALHAAEGLPELYTWEAVIPWPAEGIIQMEDGLDNFRLVKGGQLLGSVDGRQIHAPVSGRVLFPRYLTAEQQRALPQRPGELLRLLRPIKESDLPA